MQPKKCPYCHNLYYDNENKLSIVLTGACLLCRLDLSRWEEEGGNNID